ncbi:SPOR domain-containing protein [Pseudoduganella namucuonensis]|uniref:Sporulation related domain-containing protein n=1 Tax=Pseudoduganella namucuonensis TaxID=1035707 RepID=A0A1I7ETE4_9BURK|nr:SPOR domain-containing protein [Pseudoduganella namucuonensis]SFU27206.1 Sporulation related domain-containing protein [Pseudoduganella namucuonensis]
MLKFIFWSLLAVNGALYAYGQGYLGHFSGNEREPARLANQLNANKLFIIAPAKANAAMAALAAPAPAPAAVEKKPETIACLEIGNFLLPEARRFETQLAKLDLGDRQARINMPGTEISSYIVYIPPQGGKEGADKKTAELRQLGVTNYFVMSDNPTQRWGISLGVFKSETAAQNLLASLQKQGVHGARVAPRMSGSKQLAFQFRGISAEVKAQLDKIRGGFEDKVSRGCK